MQDLKYRTFQFAIAVGKLINELPFSITNKAYCSQLIRCSSSIGANYRAALRAKSNADFVNKLKIGSLVKEATEFLKMIVASINTTRLKMSVKEKQKNAI